MRSQTSARVSAVAQNFYKYKVLPFLTVPYGKSTGVMQITHWHAFLALGNYVTRFRQWIDADDFDAQSFEFVMHTTNK